MTYMMLVFPFPGLGLFLQRRAATWKSDMRGRLPVSVSSKIPGQSWYPGKTKPRRKWHQNRGRNWLVFWRWLTWYGTKNSPGPFVRGTSSEWSLPKPNRATSVKFAQFCFSNIAWKGMVVAHSPGQFWQILSSSRASSRIISLNFSSNYVTAITTDTSS